MESQFIQLTYEILTKSRENLISWSPSNYASTYQAKLGKGIIMISYDSEVSRNDNDGNPCSIYSISFLNERGQTFYSFGVLDEDDIYFDILKEIYYCAHSSYMKIDETLKSMFDDIMNR